jgi:multidrug efflux system outer membrane protein
MTSPIRLFLFLTVVTCLSGCADFRDYVAPYLPQGLVDTDLSKDGNQRIETQEPVALWWERVDDAQLKSLIGIALENNKDIAVALANLKEARALAGETGYDRTPTVTSTGGYARNRLTNEDGSISDRNKNNYEAGFDASWELDFLGRVSNRIEAARADEAAAREDLRNVGVLTAAEVGRVYIELRGAQHRLDIARRNSKNQEETYKLTRRLGEGGRSNALDEARAKTQSELTRAVIPSLEAEVTANIHRLSVLTGQLPKALEADLKPVKKLPSIPPTIHVGMAESLRRRRPDVRSAERQLAASVARYNIAVADLYPSVTIFGTLGFLATNFSNFGTGSTLQSSIGQSISWPAFDLGRVHAQIDQRDAQSQAALAVYEQTVLEALEDVQTSLSNFSQEERRREILRSAAKSSADASRLARQRFEAGVDSFLNVLDSERTQLEAEDTLAQSEIAAARDLIAIYKALGGGWQAMPNFKLELQTSGDPTLMPPVQKSAAPKS